MNVIDHRILIPTSPEIVWQYLANINNLPEWQIDTENISLLSSPNQPPGAGMRWRATSRNQREFVIMVTAWYDRVGFEYTIVDGVNLKSNKGQIRLQEIAEGTIVQWTFQYETSGLFSGLRNGLGSKRSIEQNMIDSLRMLWKVIDHKRETKDNYEARSLMRDAPDVEARANYKARHPTVFELKQDTEPITPIENVEDDTRPRGIEFEEDIAQREDEEIAVFAPPSHSIDDISSDDKFESEEEAFASSNYGNIQEDTDTFDEPVIVESKAEVAHADESDVPFAEIPKPEVDKVDTSRISVFELFGLQKPSATQEMRQVVIDSESEEEAAAEAVENMPSSPQSTTRSGLRAQLRRENARVRYPY